MRFGTPDIREWHDWFAWYPVKVRDQRVWLETVETRCIYTNRSDIIWKRHWQYQFKPPKPAPLYYPND